MMPRYKVRYGDDHDICSQCRKCVDKCELCQDNLCECSGEIFAQSSIVWSSDGKCVEFRIRDLEFFIEVDEEGEPDICVAEGERVVGYVPYSQGMVWKGQRDAMAVGLGKVIHGWKYGGGPDLWELEEILKQNSE